MGRRNFSFLTLVIGLSCSIADPSWAEGIGERVQKASQRVDDAADWTLQHSVGSFLSSFGSWHTVVSPSTANSLPNDSDIRVTSDLTELSLSVDEKTLIIKGYVDKHKIFKALYSAV